MKSQQYNVATVITVLLFVASLIGQFFFGEYATSSGIIQIEADQPELFICQMAMLISAALAVIFYLGGNRAVRREKQEDRHAAREARKEERLRQQTSFINPEDFQEEV